MSLRVHAPSAGRKDRTRSQAGTRPAEPLPILYTHTQHEGKDGPYVETYHAWNNEDGLRCRACPPGRCSFSPGAEGLGVCITRRPGLLADVPLPRSAT